ncbi:vesicle-associated protein 2-2-like [Momordica charantia]|uniref:Vesicle-associated protein 2-2-like n=1 Tax=Momordica charantia TaxID=3673 RepID=A0A6J1DM49_MOMCH|nr:vesicle-associated protein 2-2-like [Momordica charantia]
MDMKLLQVHPNELKFIFELKKQSSCSIQLTNNIFDHVAFKVKTTNVKKYCVRPNMGIIKPLSACEVTFTMQGQGVAPPDMICKDKFLILSTIVPAETTVEDITSSNLFGEDERKYIEKKKLIPTLVRASNYSPYYEALNNEVMALGVSDHPSNYDKYVEKLKLNITELELKLHEAQDAICKLEEERTRIQRKKSLEKNCLVSCSII